MLMCGVLCCAEDACCAGLPWPGPLAAVCGPAAAGMGAQGCICQHGAHVLSSQPIHAHLPARLRPFARLPQDCWVGKGGAFTGEVSAEMLHDMDVPWVILGHSGECLKLFFL